MDSPTGIMPEYLMYREQRRNAISWLIRQPWPGHLKRQMLFAWARTVAVKMTAKEVQQVIDSGREE